jgi:hypothetical protein
MAKAKKPQAKATADAGGGEVAAYYAAAPSSGLSQADAARIGPVVRDLIAEGGGEAPRLRETMVARARPKASPIHKDFEWDDKKAAHAHRLDTAGRLIRSIVIEYKTQTPTEDDDTGRVRAFHVVRSTVTADDADVSPAPPRKVYVGLKAVVENADYRAEVVERARQEFLALKAKYEFYRKKFPEFAETFGPLWAMLDQLGNE